MSQNARKEKNWKRKIKSRKELKERNEQLEGEKVRKKREIEIKEKKEMLRWEQIKGEWGNLCGTERLENNLASLLGGSKMKIIITELKRNINLY